MIATKFARPALMYGAAFCCGFSISLAPLAARPPLRLNAPAAQLQSSGGILQIPRRGTRASLSLRRDPFNDSAIRSGEMQTVLVDAVVLGAQPHAIIEESSHVRIVGLGDVVDGSPVAIIDKRGVVLKDGRIELLKGTLRCASGC